MNKNVANLASTKIIEIEPQSLSMCPNLNYSLFSMRIKMNVLQRSHEIEELKYFCNKLFSHSFQITECNIDLESLYTALKRFAR